MSRINELLEELAPDGVPHRCVSDVAHYSDTRIDAAEVDGASFVGVDNLVAHKGGRVDATYRANTSRLTEYRPGDVLLGNIRPYLKKVWLATHLGGCSGDVLALRIRDNYEALLLPEFFYYLMSSDSFFTFNMQHAKGAKMPRGDKNAILTYRIPVPPLEVQREIVRILDQFTQLEAELEAELEARRSQYEHYRSVLISSPNGPCETVTLADVVRIRNGKDHKPLADGPVPVYGSGGIMRHAEAYSAYGPSILIPRKGSLGNLFYVEGPFWNVDTIFSTEINVALINPKFLYHQLLTMRLGEMNQAGGVPSQTQGVLNRLPIILPSLEEQLRVVSLLDKFDEIVNDLSVGLPAELAARRKQYEYYRDKLLTFKEVAA